MANSCCSGCSAPHFSRAAVAMSPPGSPQHLQLGAVPAAGRVAGGVTVRSLLRKFKPVPGSHRVLIKYTNIVAVVAVPQLSGTVWGEWGVVEPPLGLGG